MSDPTEPTVTSPMRRASVAAPGVFGFYTATRGRKASAWLEE